MLVVHSGLGVTRPTGPLREGDVDHLDPVVHPVVPGRRLLPLRAGRGAGVVVDGERLPAVIVAGLGLPETVTEQRGDHHERREGQRGCSVQMHLPSAV
jgi:hypothetical protein